MYRTADMALRILHTSHLGRCSASPSATQFHGLLCTMLKSSTSVCTSRCRPERKMGMAMGQDCEVLGEVRRLVSSARWVILANFGRPAVLRLHRCHCAAGLNNFKLVMRLLLMLSAVPARACVHGLQLQRRAQALRPLSLGNTSAPSVGIVKLINSKLCGPRMPRGLPPTSHPPGPPPPRCAAGSTPPPRCQCGPR